VVVFSRSDAGFLAHRALSITPCSRGVAYQIDQDAEKVAPITASDCLVISLAIRGKARISLFLLPRIVRSAGYSSEDISGDRPKHRKGST
jgi:hypothetical protein